MLLLLLACGGSDDKDGTAGDDDDDVVGTASTGDTADTDPGDDDDDDDVIDCSGNTDPTLDVVRPVANELVLLTEDAVFEVDVGDAEQKAVDLSVTVTSSHDGLLSLPETPDPTGSWDHTYGGLTRASHLMTIRVEDPCGGAAELPRAVLVNGPPTAPVVSITPDPPTAGGTLTAILSTPSSDPEGESISYDYRWEVDGTLHVEGATPLVLPGVTQSGETWMVTATPSDPHQEGPSGSASVVIP